MNESLKSRKRRCPTGKLKIFNEAWADIVAQEQSERFGSLYRSYRCMCGWWHTYDRTKRHHKESARESRRERRKRVARGELSPFQIQRMEEERIRQEEARAKRRERQRRRRRHKAQERQMAISVWEDDGGAVLPVVEWPGT